MAKSYEPEKQQINYSLEFKKKIDIIGKEILFKTFDKWVGKLTKI